MVVNSACLVLAVLDGRSTSIEGSGLSQKRYLSLLKELANVGKQEAGDKNGIKKRS